MRAQIIYTVERLDDMLRKLADVTGYEKEATSAAQVAGGAFAGMGSAANDAVGPLNDMANALNNAADAIRNFKDAASQPTPTPETTEKKSRGVGV